MLDCAKELFFLNWFVFQAKLSLESLTNELSHLVCRALSNNCLIPRVQVERVKLSGKVFYHSAIFAIINEISVKKKIDQFARVEARGTAHTHRELAALFKLISH